MPKYSSMDADRLAARLLSEFLVARAAGDHDGMSAVMLEAMDVDRRSSGGTRVMDEIRALRRRVA